eukprot:TRINITY_DN10938_c0_g1_i1.p1 TRINITY_DN10938_c0_g1~~TRINITY_DN10938_c0_g1_i1.p1  ORF type:complete len:493 (+),score=122.47 TRINITY_DN10938_c0_g1_i1:44-1522(+)
MSATRNVIVRGLRYHQKGSPSAVLKKEEWVTPFNKTSSDVVVKMEASPVHHHDKWMIQGRCGGLEHQGSPKVGGSEGVGIVSEAGAGCKFLKKGDRVIFNNQTVGTWADKVVTGENNLDRVPLDMQPEDMAMMNVYGTAWRMVNDYGKIKPDDVCWVIGGGAVAQATACLLQQKGAKVFMIMRAGRPNEGAVHQSIRKHLPTTTTIKASLLTQKVMRTITSDIPKPSFIFNGSGGDTLRESLRYAGDSCKVISFGNMSRQPLSVSVGRHIYQDIQLLTFWYSRYLATSSREDREAMYSSIAEMMRTGAHGNTYGSEWQLASRLFVRAERYNFDTQHEDALTNSTLLFTNRKPVLRFGEEYTYTHSGEWFKEHEFFLPEDSQYVKNMEHATAERLKGEHKSVENGGPVLLDQFNALWDSKEATEIRKGMKAWNQRLDNTELLEDTYERYLETQAAKYNINLNVETRKKGQLSHNPHMECFFPDDDALVSKTLN